MREKHEPQKEREQVRELERDQLGGPADYDEGGGTGLEPQPGDAVIGGGVSGSDEDPIGEPGIPDEVAPGRPRRRPRGDGGRGPSDRDA